MLSVSTFNSSAVIWSISGAFPFLRVCTILLCWWFRVDIQLPLPHFFICRWVWWCLPVQDSLKVLLPSCLPFFLTLAKSSLLVGNRRCLPRPAASQLSGDVVQLLSSPVLCCCLCYLGLLCHSLPLILSHASLHLLILLPVLLCDLVPYPL